MGRLWYFHLRRYQNVRIRRRGDVPLRRLGDVPSRRRRVFHLRRTIWTHLDLQRDAVTMSPQRLAAGWVGC